MSGTSGDVNRDDLGTSKKVTRNQKKSHKKRHKRLKTQSDDEWTPPISPLSEADLYISDKQFENLCRIAEERDSDASQNTQEIDSDDSIISVTDTTTSKKGKGKGKKTQIISKAEGANVSTSESNDSQLSHSTTPDWTISNHEPTDTKMEPESSNETDLYCDPQPSTSSINDDNAVPSVPNANLIKKSVPLYAPDDGPMMYQARGNLVTPPIITKNLPTVFQFLPIHGKPAPNSNLQEFYRNKIREYVGCGLTGKEFDELEKICSPELLKTGNEIKMQTSVPVMGVLLSNILHNNFFKPEITGDPPNLIILKKNKLRMEQDTKKLYIKNLKYRGVRIMPCTQELQGNDEDLNPPSSKLKPAPTEPDVDLEPGTDILYKVRIYRPYAYNMSKDRYTRSRHSVFSCDVLLTGRHKLTALRDRFVCYNDFDLRVDVSEHPDIKPTATAKEAFPSGFLFINNVFYVDTRDGCIDYSEPIREWAIKKKIGSFPKKDMCTTTLSDLVLKLGYPEVYVHQGNCEHVFLFSEVRLLNTRDPLHFSNYPCSTAIAQNQTVYCTTCAEFSAKWIVVGSDRIPFDPGFFCDACYRQYMYNGTQKNGDFKAYRYRGNALNMLKP